MSTWPPLVRLRQRFDRPRVLDIAVTVRAEIAKLLAASPLREGATVAITAGSRGIAAAPALLAAAAGAIREAGGKPFLVPAMGSHGGATAAGQQTVLAKLGITEQSIGCPIRATMHAERIAEGPHGMTVYCDSNALQADHVLLCNRIKPHTMFTGPVQSGLIKMLLVGLGKQVGAEAFHRCCPPDGFEQLVRGVLPSLLSRLPLLGGLAIVENAYKEPGLVESVLPAELMQRESALLQQAVAWMPHLPWKELEILVLDEIGKNVSGTGLDTNVVGRKFDDNKAVAGEQPQIQRIVARGLTPESAGNAVGLGIADFCSRRLASQIDYATTWVNGLTACHVGAVKTPPTYETDRELLAAALTTLRMPPDRQPRIAWARNTGVLDELACSESCLPELAENQQVDVLTAAQEIPWDTAGNLPATLHDWPSSNDSEA